MKTPGWKKKIFPLLHQPYSLKERLIAILLLSSLIPVVLIGTISYTAIHSLLKNNIENSIRSNLQQVILNLENVIDSLDSISKQLAFEGNMENLSVYLHTDDILRKYEIGIEITNYMNLIYNTNPNLGIMFYYFPERQNTLAANLKPNPAFEFDEIPFFTDVKGAKIYGPHRSAYTGFSNMVFSVVRKVGATVGEECYVYVETNYKVLESVLNTLRDPMEISNLLIDSNGVIKYSETENGFPTGFVLNNNTYSNGKKDNYIFTEKSEQGWQIAAVIKRNVYDKAVFDWVRNYLLIGALSLLIGFLLSIVIWSIVYKPISNLIKKIKLVAENRFDFEIEMTSIKEFNDLLTEFGHMRKKIVQLLYEIEQKEKLKRDIEVQNLLHQINPHFLHNTLNTIQWMARLNGHDDIDRLVVLLTRVLHYNLGKEGTIVTVKEEISALKDYVDLQRIRSDYQFDVKIEIDPDVLDLKIPRFITQPLVENAIFHGLKGEEGCIHIRAYTENKHMWIIVKDNGAGLETGDIDELFTNYQDDAQKKAGLGIGLNYVKQVLQMHYEEQAEVNVYSEPGNGAIFELIVPVILPVR